MLPISIRAIVAAALQFYSLLIIVYVIMTWFPVSGVMEDFFRVLASLVEPYLVLFRRFVPSMGGMDFSPFIALLVIWAVQNYVVRLIPF
jgi:YggT family protein